MSSELATYMDLIAGAEPAGGFLEVRHRRTDRGGMGQSFFPWPEERAPVTELIRRLGRETDVYLGVAPRRRRHGGRDSVNQVHVVWVDADSKEAVEALGHFTPAPSLVISSGWGKHGYWALRWGASPEEAEQANRRLAYALGADMASTDAARILRPPGTFNFKGTEPRPVVLEHLAVEVFEVGDVVGDLPDPPTPRRDPAPAPRMDSDDPLLGVAPPVYVEALTRREVGRDGKAQCPFHAGGEERTPSLHAYPTAEAGWTCFAGCGGGSIVDFGALLYGIEPRGRGYHEIRRRLEADLLPALRMAA